MKFYLVLPICLVLASTVYQTRAEDAISEGAATKDAIADGAVAGDAISEGAEARDKVDAGTIDGDAIVEGVISEDSAVAADLVSEDATIDCLYQKPDCFCLQQEDPVCSINGCTYGNDCKRICADAEFAYAGACHEDDLDVVE